MKLVGDCEAIGLTPSPTQFAVGGATNGSRSLLGESKRGCETACPLTTTLQCLTELTVCNEAPSSRTRGGGPLR
jgi:hypothetical protein